MQENIYVLHVDIKVILLGIDVDGALNAGWNMAWYNPKNLPSEGREPHLNFQDFQELTDVLG